MAMSRENRAGFKPIPPDLYGLGVSVSARGIEVILRDEERKEELVVGGIVQCD